MQSQHGVAISTLTAAPMYGQAGDACADCYRTDSPPPHTPAPASTHLSNVLINNLSLHQRPTAHVFTPPSQTRRLCDSTALSRVCVFIHASARVHVRLFFCLFAKWMPVMQPPCKRQRVLCHLCLAASLTNSNQRATDAGL